MKKVLAFVLAFLVFGNVMKAQETEVSDVAMAQFCNMIGDYSTALEYAEMEIAKNPKSAEAYLESGRALYNLDQYSKAVGMLEKAMDYGKKNKEIVANSCLYLSYIYFEQGESSKAQKIIEKGLKAKKDDKDLLISRISHLYNTERKIAEQDIEKLKKIYPDDDYIYARIAISRWMANDLDKALEDANKAVTLNNKEAFNYFIRGRIKADKGDREGALSDMVMSYLVDPNSDSLSLLKDIEDTSDRKYIISELERMQSSYEDAGLLEATLLTHWGMTSQAENLLKKLCENPNADTRPYVLLSILQKASQGPMQAYKTINKGLTKFLDNPDLLKYKAELITELGKPDEALNIIDRLLDQNEDCDDCLKIKGRAFLMKGDYENAVKTYQIMNEEEFDADVLIDLLLSLKFYGAEDSAKDLAQAIVNSADDQFNDGEKNSSYYKMIAYSILGNKFRAREEALNALPERNEGINYYTEAIIETLSGEKEQAVENLKKAVDALDWNTADFIYEPIFYPLHSINEFSAIVNKFDNVSIKKDPLSDLYRLDSFNFLSDIETRGTSIEDLKKIKFTDFKTWVKEVNKLCPININNLVLLTAVKYDEKKNHINIYYEFDPNVMDMDIYINNPTLKEKYLEINGLQYLLHNPELANIQGISWIYNSRNQKKNFTMTLDQSRLKKLAKKIKSQEEIDIMTVDFLIELEKANSEGEDDIFRDNKNVYCILSLNPQEENWDALEIFQDELKKGMEDYIISTFSENFAKSLIRLDMSLIIKYINSEDGKVIEMKFSPEDLSRIFNYYPYTAVGVVNQD